MILYIGSEIQTTHCAILLSAGSMARRIGQIVTNQQLSRIHRKSLPSTMRGKNFIFILRPHVKLDAEIFPVGIWYSQVSEINVYMKILYLELC
jgi:hypothetical protein